ncbi:hypothetical protein EVAR_60447_1 [Eumeta japonica]|uniref:Mariner Mos1 transposase n=1 Tax=Eumeta variegata TaxID=151549 RepID=A0A4C1Z1U5_EUMVA|nr:hypothetical protein EVAR_60447_1 [Eumeta japonica]
MIASFFNKTGHLATIPLENCPIVNSDWYTTIYLSEVIDELRKNNRKRRTILHLDNAYSHTAKQTNKLVKEKDAELMSNPVYSLDLAPCYAVIDLHHRKRPSNTMKYIFPGSP